MHVNARSFGVNINIADGILPKLKTFGGKTMKNYDHRSSDSLDEVVNRLYRTDKRESIIACVLSFPVLTAFVLFVALMIVVGGEISASSNVAIRTDTIRPSDDAAITTKTITITVGSRWYTTIAPQGTRPDDIVWSSSDLNIATVSEGGIVQGVSFGKAIVTATAGEESCALTVYVGPETPLKVVVFDNITEGQREYVPSKASGFIVRINDYCALGKRADRIRLIGQQWEQNYVRHLSRGSTGCYVFNQDGGSFVMPPDFLGDNRIVYVYIDYVDDPQAIGLKRPRAAAEFNPIFVG
ncbi:hypothetical protein FACS1894132_02140 [Clostridia bacterium]|nr:hypothetical protein FACS1894132_02140 [Clostridia bacterium]